MAHLAQIEVGQHQNESMLCNNQVRANPNAASNAKIKRKTRSNNLCREDNSKCNSSKFKDSVSQPTTISTTKVGY